MSPTKILCLSLLFALACAGTLAARQDEEYDAHLEGKYGYYHHDVTDDYYYDKYDREQYAPRYGHHGRPSYRHHRPDGYPDSHSYGDDVNDDYYYGYKHCPECRYGLDACLGECLNFQNNTLNCGACRRDCPSGSTCVSANCTCDDPDLSFCELVNGTETTRLCANLATDPFNCGVCGKICASGQACVNSTCVVNTCTNPNPDNCNGVCTNTNTDLANCGQCEKTCAANNICVGGSCCGQNNAVCLEKEDCCAGLNCVGAGGGTKVCRTPGGH